MPTSSTWLASLIHIAGIVGPLAAISVAMAHVPGTTGSSGTSNAHSKGGSLSGILTPAILGLLAFYTLVSLANGGINSFSVAAFVNDYGLTYNTANVALTAYLGCGAAGVLVGGFLADRTHRHGQVAAACFAANAVIVGLIAVLSLPALLIVLMMGLAVALHPSPASLVAAAEDAGKLVFGIILQFPLYAGMYGIIQGTHLAESLRPD